MGKTFWLYLLKLDTCIPHDLELLRLGIDPTNVHTCSKRTAAVFLRLHHWKLSKGPSTVEQMHALWQRPTLEHYPTVTSTQLLHARIHPNFTSMMLSKKKKKKPERKRLHIVCVHIYEMQKQAKLIGSVEVRITAAHRAGR